MAGCDDLLVLEQALRWIEVSRAIDHRLMSAHKQGRLKGRMLSGRGQEAIPIGAGLCLEDHDLVAPAHRDMVLHLLRGGTPLDIMRSYLTRATGLSAGRDSDVHMGDWSRGVLPMVSHLPDSWPIAAGFALAQKLGHRPGVTIAFCGDGATSTGTWHEVVNFSAVQQLPIVLVVEDNQYAYSTPTESQFRCANLVDRAAGYGIAGEPVDGNDVTAVHYVVGRALARARAGEGPTLVVAETMRMEGHAIHDAAAYVPDELRAEWAAKDPLDRVQERLRRVGWDDARFAEVRERARVEVREAWDKAEAEPLPDGASVTSGVYASDDEA
jgi:TPP-dependent pyruvate/acetoin dehydrogenase alpha subunit